MINCVKEMFDIIKIVFAVFIGLVCNAHAQHSRLADDTAIKYIPPSVPLNCSTREGGPIAEILTPLKDCIRKEAVANNGRYGLTDDYTTRLCRVVPAIPHCHLEYVERLKGCMNTDEAKAKEFDSVLDQIEENYKYLCADKGKEIREIMSQKDNVECIKTMVAKAGRCRFFKWEQINAHFNSNDLLEGEYRKWNQETYQLLNTDKLVDEKFCLVSFNAGRCVLEPLKNCRSKKPYNYYRGLQDAVFSKSPCGRFSFRDEEGPTYEEEGPTYEEGKPTFEEKEPTYEEKQRLHKRDQSSYEESYKSISAANPLHYSSKALNEIV